MSKKYFDIHKPVFWPAIILIVLFISVTLIVGEPMESFFGTFKDWVTDKTGWVFIITVNAFVIFCIYLAFSKYGSIRLGGKDAEPEFTTAAWFAMLFSAGMGIGLLFWGVAEPVFHYKSPPFGEGGTVDAAERAMNYTFMHWGFHAWAIYALVALSLGFFAFNKGLPLTIRSVFYPILGDRIYGWIGDVIDVFAVLATLFGLATSLGLGVKQVGAGISFLTGLENTVWLQVVLIAGITLIATLSVVAGVEKGVKMLSEWNIRIAATLLVFILIVGPTLFIFRSTIQNIGNYLTNIVQVASWTEAYRDQGWQGDWTVFYWAWWISWSPFVGMFIARVSKGRTIREFITGVLLIPSFLTFFWLSAMGGSAIFIDLHTEGSLLADNIIKDEATALFFFLEEFPLTTLGSIVGIILIASFFVTSSDSGSLVIDSITAGGKLDAPVAQRVFWAVAEGTVAAVLLIGGGLTALQTATITTGLPFLFILIVMAYALRKGLKQDYAKQQLLSQEQSRKKYEEKLAKVVLKNIQKENLPGNDNSPSKK